MTQSTSLQSSAGVLPAKTHIGPVELSVSDLAQSDAYYREVIGLETLDGGRDWLRLGAGDRPLLELQAMPGARRVPHTTGLYHFALLVPSRIELARTLRHLAEMQAHFVGFADHYVSEALYLSDPDGHGIEIYRDRPRPEWVDEQGNFKLTTDPLDIDGLLGMVKNETTFTWQSIHPETIMGHIHLHVANLQAAKNFYLTVLGFDLMAEMGSAAFISAGGYHHHIGMNLWAGVNIPPPPADSLRLIAYTIMVPDVDEMGNSVIMQLSTRLDQAGISYAELSTGLEVADPSGNVIRIKTA